MGDKKKEDKKRTEGGFGRLPSLKQRETGEPGWAVVVVPGGGGVGGDARRGPRRLCGPVPGHVHAWCCSRRCVCSEGWDGIAVGDPWPWVGCRCCCCCWSLLGSSKPLQLIILFIPRSHTYGSRPSIPKPTFTIDREEAGLFLWPPPLTAVGLDLTIPRPSPLHARRRPM